MPLTKPTIDIRWAENDVSNGANNTLNKVEQTDTHKDDGWNYPEVPPRNYWNYWMNGVWQWQQYMESWVDTAGRLGDNFAQNPATTSGLTFGYFGGEFQINKGDVATSVLTITAGTILLTASTTTHVYIDLSDNTLKTSESGIPTVYEGVILLYIITTDGSGITSLDDKRVFAHIFKRATTAQAQAGTEQNNFMTPKTLQDVTATESRRGVAEIATDAETTAGTDDTRIVSPKKLTTFGAATYLKLDGSNSMSGALNLAGNYLYHRNDGAANKSQLLFDNVGKQWYLKTNADDSLSGNGVLNLGILKSDTVKILALTQVTWDAVNHNVLISQNDANGEVKRVDFSSLRTAILDGHNHDGDYIPFDERPNAIFINIGHDYNTKEAAFDYVQTIYPSSQFIKGDQMVIQWDNRYSKYHSNANATWYDRHRTLWIKKSDSTDDGDEYWTHMNMKISSGWV